MPAFHLSAPYLPKGDQPAAIEQLVKDIDNGARYQTLLGATGTGKTFTMANVIAQTGRPALVLAHNKTIQLNFVMSFASFPQMLLSILFLIMIIISLRLMFLLVIRILLKLHLLMKRLICFVILRQGLF